MNETEAHVISLDLGTSSIRTALVNQSLKILKLFSYPVRLKTYPEARAEQDVHEIIQTALISIKEIINWAINAGIHVQALGFSNASASLIGLDANLNPITPALTYADLRASAESHFLVNKYGRDYFHSTAAPVHASYWLPKLLWLKNNDPNFPDYAYFCTIKDLLVYNLSGQFVTDISNAAATGMCVAGSGSWDLRLLNIIGITKNQLPKIRPTTTTLALQSPTFLEPIQSAALPNIVLGAMDGVLASLGAGAFKPGQVTTTVGSSGACRIARGSPLIDKRADRIWSYPLDENIWICGGAMNNGGLVTEWLANNFTDSRNNTNEAFSELFSQAEKITVGSAGLIFLPYLLGERAPIYDEKARGVFFGLHNGHHRGHLARAGLEGILFALYSIFEIIRADNDEPVEIIATGGYLRSDLMLQIQADIFGEPIQIPSNLEGSIIGAAVLAFKALGMIDSFNDLSNHFITKKVIIPNVENTKIYQDCFSLFKALYAHLKPLF